MDLPDIPPDPRILPKWTPFTFEKNRKITLDDFKPMFEGRMDLPNFERIPLHEAARHAAYFYGKMVEGQYVKLPGGSVYDRSWSHGLYMLDCGQGGGLTGKGWVITQQGLRYDEESVVGGRFALCVHEFESTLPAGFDPRRGWAPGYCKKCGLDMSVDSGD